MSPPDGGLSPEVNRRWSGGSDPLRGNPILDENLRTAKVYGAYLLAARFDVEVVDRDHP